jgi:hypothetical protein
LTAGIKANADGSAAIQVGGSDAITITSALNTTFAGTANVATGALYPIVSGTSVTASGTSVNFTGIPSWVKRITVMLQGVSTNGTSVVQVQIGSGSVSTSGYNSSSSYIAASVVTSQSTTGFLVDPGAVVATNFRTGNIVLTNLSSNLWIASGLFKTDSTADTSTVVGSITLGGALDRVRITTVNGTDTFDAGSINILYE